MGGREYKYTVMYLGSSNYTYMLACLSGWMYCICGCTVYAFPCLPYVFPCLPYLAYITLDLNPASWAALVAQLAEHWTSNPVVTGSNPVRDSSVLFFTVCLWTMPYLVLPSFAYTCTRFDHVHEHSRNATFTTSYSPPPSLLSSLNLSFPPLLSLSPPPPPPPPPLVLPPPGYKGGEGGAEIRQLSTHSPQDSLQLWTAASEERDDDLREAVCEGVKVQCPQGVETRYLSHVFVRTRLGGREGGSE